MSRALRPPLTARLRSRTSALVGAILAVLPLLAGGCALGGSGGAPGAAQFIRPGAERATEQLRIASAGRVGSSDVSPTATRYADNQVFIVLPSPGCWELTARLGASITRTVTFYVYN